MLSGILSMFVELCRLACIGLVLDSNREIPMLSCKSSGPNSLNFVIIYILSP